jgi:hypothetical protein
VTSARGTDLLSEGASGVAGPGGSATTARQRDCARLPSILRRFCFLPETCSGLQRKSPEAFLRLGCRKQPSPNDLRRGASRSAWHVACKFFLVCCLSSGSSLKLELRRRIVEGVGVRGVLQDQRPALVLPNKPGIHSRTRLMRLTRFRMPSCSSVRIALDRGAAAGVPSEERDFLGILVQTDVTRREPARHAWDIGHRRKASSA